MKDTKKIKIEGKTYEIKKIPIRKNAEVSAILVKAIPKVIYLLENADITEAEFLNSIPLMLENIQDELFDFVALATDIEKEIILELGYDEFLDLAIAIFELNNVHAIIDRVKKITGVLQKSKK